MIDGKPRLERMYLEILLGISQNDSLLKPLSADEVAQWARLDAQVKEIRDNGGGFIIPNELPNMEEI
jgi:hypothetical protein